MNFFTFLKTLSISLIHCTTHGKNTKTPWGFNWRGGSIAYKLQRGAEHRRALRTMQSPLDQFSDSSSLEYMLLTMARMAINDIAPTTVQFIDKPQTAKPAPLTWTEKRALIPEMYELLAQTFLAPIPKQLTSNHMNRIRILRALAPVICQMMNSTFDPALGECIEPANRLITNYQTWNLTEFADDQSLLDGLGEISQVAVGVEERWPEFDSSDLICDDNLT